MLTCFKSGFFIVFSLWGYCVRHPFGFIFETEILHILKPQIT